MIITTTAVAFLVLGLGIGFCGWRFYRAFKKSGNQKSGSKIGFLITFFLFGFAFQTAIILGIGTILFSGSSNGLLWVFIIANAFLTFLAMLGVYISYYIFLPDRSPRLLISITFGIGVILFFLTLISDSRSFITQAGSVEWSVSFPISILTFYLLLISIGAQLYIFGRLFLLVKILEVKILSFSLVILALGGIIDQFIRFILLHRLSTDIRIQTYDIGTAFIGIGFIVVFVIFPLVKNWINKSKNESNLLKEI